MVDVGVMDSFIVRSALSKASWRIFPLLGIGYLIAYMDRVNVSIAALQMNVDLGFSATVYGLGAGMFFLSYSLFEIPSNLLLIRFGARRWIARIMITWGVLAAAMMFIHTPMHFYILRFLIGLAEAGFFPGAVYYLTHWFPSSQRGRAISRFYLFNPLAMAVMGVLSVGLLALDGLGGLRGWQWLFLVEGLPALLIGIAIYFFLPDSPQQAGWLSEAERDWLTGELARDAARVGDIPHQHVLASLRNPLVLWLAAINLLQLGAFLVFSLSAPMVLKAGAGLSNATVGYLVSLGGIVGVLSMLSMGWLTDLLGDRFKPLLAVLPIGALSILVTAVAPWPLAVIVAYLIFSAANGAAAVAQTTIWTDVFPVRVLGVCIAAINTVLQMGVFIGSAGFGVTRDVTGSFKAGLLVFPVCYLSAFVLSALLMRQLNVRSARVGAA